MLSSAAASQRRPSRGVRPGGKNAASFFAVVAVVLVVLVGVVGLSSSSSLHPLGGDASAGSWRRSLGLSTVGAGNATTPGTTAGTTGAPAPPAATTKAPAATTMVPALTSTAAPTTTSSVSASSAPLPTLCSTTCIPYMDTHPDEDCTSILDHLGADCTTCGCKPDPSDPFFHSIEFYLAVTAGCVFVVAALFIGICLCRRNRATTTYTTTTTLSDANALLGDEGFGNPSAGAGTYTAPVDTGVAGESGQAEEIARVRYNFTADPAYDEQLSVNKNDRVIVLEKFDDGWWNIKHLDSGRVGIVPASYCTIE